MNRPRKNRCQQKTGQKKHIREKINKINWRRYNFFLMALALYRKYRPQKFSEIVGQEHVKKTLQNEIQQKRLAHAYLFCGPRGISKTTTARILAKTVNCLQRGDASEPCNKCSNCQSIMEGRFFDLLEIDAASHTGVDHVRDQIINTAKIVPSKGQFKVFVIDEVHMLSISAFNALLKILEEPPSHVIFILATTEVHKIPGTIISRCQRFDFRKIDNASMIGRLQWITKKEKIAVEPEVFQLIARHAAGHQRDAERMLSQVLTLDNKKITLEMAELVLPRSNTILVWKFVSNLQGRQEKNIDLLQENINNGLDLEQFAKEIVEFLRQLLLVKMSKKLDKTTSLDLDQDSFQELLVLVKNMPLADLVLLLELFLEAEQKMKQDHFVVQLPLELALMKYTIARPEQHKVEPLAEVVVATEKK